MITITELIDKLSECRSKYGEGMIVIVDSNNDYFRNGFNIDLGNYNGILGWEYLLQINDI